VPLLNSSIAVKPGTTVQFKPELPLVSQKLTLSFVRETTTTPKPAPTTQSVPNTGWNVPFATAGTYDLSWHTDTVGPLGIVTIGATQTGKLLVDSNAQNCVIAVQVPTPSVSVSGVPDPVTSTVNGIIGGVTSTVNGVLNPVNGVVGPIVGGVGNPGLPSPGLPGGSGSGSSGGGVPGVGTDYHPSGPTVAQRTVPQGYGNGSGVGGTYVPSGTAGTGGAVTGTGTATGKSGTAAGQQPVKSGGSPKTVQLAADKPRSALDGWSALIVLGAVLALSGATAFYARSYLLQPLPTKVKA
jgi:hypothetical protein